MITTVRRLIYLFFVITRSPSQYSKDKTEEEQWKKEIASKYRDRVWI